MKKSLIVGIDCGGTKTKACIFEISLKDKIKNNNYNNINNKQNTQLPKCIQTILVEKPSEKKVVLDIINQILSDKTRKKNIKAIGIGFPAPIKKGVIYGANNLQTWKYSNIEKELTKNTKIPVIAENDARCFTYGVHSLPKYSKYQSLIGITLGTGIGCGVIINNSIYSGLTGAAGEICKIPYKNSILENYTSKKFFMQNYNKDPRLLVAQGLHGSPIAKQAFNEYGQHLGNMLATICLTYEPECIVFGGSISKSYWKFANSMTKVAKQKIYPQTAKQITITVCTEENIATYGAAKLAYDTITQNKVR